MIGVNISSKQSKQTTFTELFKNKKYVIYAATGKLMLVFDIPLKYFG